MKKRGVIFGESLGNELADMARSRQRGEAPGRSNVVPYDDPPALAHAIQPITKGYYGKVQINGVEGMQVDAYARNGDVDTGEPFIIYWTPGMEISSQKGEDPPRKGQWEIFSFDVNYFGLPFASQGCGCGDSLDGTANHDCKPECGCINKTRYMYPPAWWVRWPDALEKILWSAASSLVTLKYSGECLWVSNWFAGPDYIPPEEEWEGEEAPEPVHDDYRWEVDRRALTIKLRRRSVEYPNAPEIYVEYCLTPACGLRCNGVWKGTLKDFRNVEPPAVCEICVTPTLRLPFYTCWSCPQDPPEAYEMTVPDGAFYSYTPTGGEYTEKLIGVAGKKITLQRVGACDNWVVPVDDPNFWMSSAGECPDIKGISVPGFPANLRLPRGGNCNAYKFEDSTTLVWLFVEAGPGEVFAAATFIDKDLCEYEEFCTGEGQNPRLYRYYVLHEGEGGTPSYEGQESENWCQEPTLELRADWFDNGRSLTSQTKYWYDTEEDMEAQNGYSLVEGDLNNYLFAVKSINSTIEGNTGFFLALVSTVPGETAWSYQGSVNPAYDPGIDAAERAGIVQIKGISLPKVTNSGAPGSTCSGEETEAGSCPPTATCRWEEAFTSNVQVVCVDGVPQQEGIDNAIADLEPTIPENASAEYDVVIGACADGFASLRLRYMYLVTPCPDGCEECEDPGDITGLPYLEQPCNQA
ncbi:hypothetical protein [Planctomyces sp. SH-PL14]|uniref:hypothetical protein n=1 Tax=Planctomyces sp. SH-PL14 TaxID=1632864 RepID=UPI00078C9B0D|nr:hypothetical protein [Planctomyces sp. SH-PL14]AMV20404.1 hypothetical protein VT03_21075 [Planctomyces sp. SH-PL14]